MNWGYKILFVYIVFVSGILLLVLKSSTQKIDLVTTDYYAKELKYQDRIDAVKRTQALSAPLTYEIVNKQMIVSFPKEFFTKQIAGTILLYCPSDDRKDFQQRFSTSTGAFSFSLPANNKGAHEVQVSWQADSSNFYFENKLVL